MNPTLVKFLKPLGYILTVPATLIGLLLAIFYRPTSLTWSEGCLEAVGGTSPDGETLIWGRPGAQTLGFLIYYASPHHRSRKDLRVHERTHVVQGFILGPIFALSYIILFFIKYAAQGFKDWHRAYMWNPYEKQAYKVQFEYVAGSRPDAWGSKGV